MQSDSDIKILAFTFECKHYELDSSVTFSQLFKMEYKSFLCCGKKFYQAEWIKNDRVIIPSYDDQISEYIENGDNIKCQIKYSIRNYHEKYRITMLAGLNGPDFQTEYQENTQKNAEIAIMIQEAITN